MSHQPKKSLSVTCSVRKSRCGRPLVRNESHGIEDRHHGVQATYAPRLSCGSKDARARARWNRKETKSRFDLSSHVRIGSFSPLTSKDGNQHMYRLAWTDECNDLVGEFKSFTTMYVYYGCWKMNIRKQDRHKHALLSHAGMYQCVRIPLRHKNPPDCFQRALDLLLTKYNSKTCLV